MSLRTSLLWLFAAATSGLVISCPHPPNEPGDQTKVPAPASGSVPSKASAHAVAASETSEAQPPEPASVDGNREPSPDPELEQPEADREPLEESDIELTALTSEGQVADPDAAEDEPDEAVGAAGPYHHPDFGVDPERALTATRKETYIFQAPSWRSKKLGYLRTGAVVKRSAEPVKSAKDCQLGWYQVEPEGYVCAGNTASTDINHPLALAARHLPDRSSGLPYAYGISRYPTPPFYTKLPTAAEQRKVEPGLDRVLAQGSKSWDKQVFDAVPEFLEGGKQAPTLTGKARGPGTLYSGRGLVKSGFAFLRVFESDGRRFGLSTDLAVLPLDRVKHVKPSQFRGVTLEDSDLPVAFNRAQLAAVFSGDPKLGLKQDRVLGYREAVRLSGKATNLGGVRYVETRDGFWLRDQGLTHVGKMTKVPGWATPGRPWLDISILKQTLVAYVGTKPVYATLVSTGADGLGDPKETHSTVRGQFLIHTKHVTATMSGDEAGDEFDLRDVPYVQYFHEGYALHAAYWHDSFGKPRSHGCINLSPEDARWLFSWSDPPVPPKWHGAMSLTEGTLVHIHP